VVIDSASTDGTADIACQAGARVVQFAWKGEFPRKKNWALENLPFRNEATVRSNSQPFEVGLQEFVDQLEWGAQVGNPVSYAPYIRKSPLAGNAPKTVIYQFARGDQTVRDGCTHHRDQTERHDEQARRPAGG
jgi:hypothetical protein